MPRYYLNDNELNAAMLRDFKIVVGTSSKDFKEKLTDEFIEEEVYGAGEPSWYPRLRDEGGLTGTFVNKQIETIGQQIEGGVDQDTENFFVEPEAFIHGSLYWSEEDVSPFLTEWIIQGKSGPLFDEGFWREPRDFWTPMEEFLTTEEADAFVEEAMTNLDLAWIKII